MKQQLVIIPGWGGTKQSWAGFAAMGKDEFDIHLLELPCFGDAPCPQEIWGVEEYAMFVKDAIRSLEKPILLGHSFGGQVAVNVAANNPELISNLILSGAAIMRPKYTLKRMFFSVVAKIGKRIFRLPLLNRVEKLAKKILYKAADSPDYGKTEGIKREIFQKVIRQSQVELLPKIKAPTLVVWGSRDSYVPLQEGKRIAQLIPGADLKVIEGAKHGLHIQQPENLLSIIKEFLNK